MDNGNVVWYLQDFAIILSNTLILELLYSYLG